METRPDIHTRMPIDEIICPCGEWIKEQCYTALKNAQPKLLLTFGIVALLFTLSYYLLKNDKPKEGEYVFLFALIIQILLILYYGVIA